MRHLMEPDPDLDPKTRVTARDVYGVLLVVLTIVLFFFVAAYTWTAPTTYCDATYYSCGNAP